MRTWRTTTTIVGSVTVLALLLAACGNPSQDVAGCTGVDDAVTTAISQRLDVGAGTLRNAKQVRAGRTTFISAELHARADAKHDKGDVLTWATRNLKGATFEAVDEHARTNSSWPRAAFNVSAKGAYASRACTDINRGKTKAQIACEQRQTDANAPAIGAGSENCDNL